MAAFHLRSLLRPELAELEAYVPDLGAYAIRLDANEAPPTLGDRARTRLAEAVEGPWERYPDPTARELREAIARRCNVSPAEVLPGVGSDEIIASLLTACNASRGRHVASVLTTTPTFVMYRMSAKVRGMSVVEVPLDRQWDLPIDSLCRAAGMIAPALVFIASPNNPTGNLMSRQRLGALVEAVPESLVVIDEAYIDYADGDQLDLYRRYPNVAVMRTLSKVGFAALRVGWLVGSAELVAELDKVRQPYNLNTLSQRLATLVLDELGPEVANATQGVVRERERVAGALDQLPGVEVAPRAANFVWVRTPRPAGEVHTGLAERGILVRSFHNRGGRLANHVRITISTPAENDALLAAMREVV